MTNDKYSANLPTTPACWTCARKFPNSASCTAYPEGIPDAILDGTHQHREHYPGDYGILYTPEASP